MEQVVKSMREIMLIDEEQDVIVAVKAGHEHTMSTPARVRQVMEAVPSDHLKFMFDPAKLLGPEWLYHQYELYKIAVELYGNRVMCVHFKGVRFENGQRFSCALEDGQVDYEAAIRTMQDLPQVLIPISREEAVPSRAHPIRPS